MNRSPTPGPDPELERALCAEQTRLHGRALPASVALALALALGLGALLQSQVSATALLAWLSAVVLVMAARIGLHLHQRDAASRDPANPRWRRRCRALLALQGVSWAAGGAFMFMLPAGRTLDLLIVGLIGLAAGALVSYAFDRQAALAYAAPVALPVAAYLVQLPHGTPPASLGLVALLLPLALLGLLRAHRLLHDSVTAQLQQRRRAEELTRAADRADRTGTIAGVGSWELDATLQQLSLSPHALRLLGLPADALPTLDTWLNRLQPDCAERLRGQLQQALHTGEDLSAELTLQSGPTARHILQLEGRVRRVDGHIMGIDGALLDVTRLRGIDRSLAEHHQLLEQLMVTASQGICFLDVQGRVKDLNPAMAALLGRPRQAILHTAVGSWLDGASRVALESWLGPDAAGQAGALEIDLPQPDGSRRRCLVHRSPLAGAGGGSTGWVAIWTDITERHRAEQAQRIFASVIDASDQMISVVDEHHRYRMVNDAWLRMTGLTREQAIGQTAPALLPAAVHGERLAAVRLCIEEGRRVTVRTPMLLGPGPQRLIESDFFPIRIEHDGPRLVAVVSRDVTPEVERQQALEASAEFLRGALDATGEAIFATDAIHDDDTPRFANEQLFALWRIPDEVRKAPTLRAITDALYANAVDAVAERVRVDAIIARGVPVQDRIELRDGRKLVRRFAPVPLQGRVLRVWSFRDVTAEVRAIEAREAAAAEQRALFDNFPGYIAVLDEQLRYRHVNDALARLWRHDAADVIGRTPTEVLGDLAARKLQHYIDRAMLSGQSVSESHYPAPDGQGSLELEVTHVAGPRHADGSRSLFAFGVDVTERKRAQEALIDALAEAERANSAKSRFLSHMSHELRTPLNAVMGFGQLLAVQPLTPQQQQQVREVLQGGRHLMTLINDLLDLGRIEAGSFAVSCEAVDAAQAVADTVALMAPLALQREVRLQQSGPLPSSGSQVWADPRRLQQVLLNLVSNAIQYNQIGGTVDVQLLRCDDALEIRVVDSGPGLSDADQQRLFKPFERLNPKSADGTGIGLALSRNLVEAMGGQIGVRSQAGAGATFWVRLHPPTAQALTPAPAVPADAAPAPMPLLVDGRRPRALYIEDNPINLMLLAAMLEEVLELSTESDAQRGLDLALATVPDLILLDIQLPGMDGFEVLRRLRADERTRQVPVVAVSANAMPADLAAGRAAGFDAYVTKPVDLGTLMRSLREVLDHKAALQAAAHG